MSKIVITREDWDQIFLDHHKEVTRLGNQIKKMSAHITLLEGGDVKHLSTEGGDCQDCSQQPPNCIGDPGDWDECDNCSWKETCVKQGPSNTHEVEDLPLGPRWGGMDV